MWSAERVPGAGARQWRCEGRLQDPDQMDLWECLDEVVLDQQRQQEINEMEDKE